MTYQLFQENVLNYFRTHLGESASVSIQSVTKNNNVILDGLLILDDDTNISPTIYLNYYYEQYLQGMPIEEVYEEIYAAYQNNKPTEKIDIRFFTEYSNISDKIFCKLINTKQNQNLLKTVPHRPFLDLSVVYYCMIDCNQLGCATILINNEHIKYWNVCEEDLYQLAKENTSRLLPPKLFDLNSLLNEMAPSLFETEEFVQSPIYVLTNSHKMYGASSLLFQKDLNQFALTQACDFYIIPSSIHEVLLLPFNPNSPIQPQELNQMVQEVNLTQVATEEVLSDHIYFYSLQSQKVEILNSNSNDEEFI